MNGVEFSGPSERRCFGPFVLVPNERLLTKDGAVVDIGGRSFDLLEALTATPGRVVSKRQLLKQVWSDVVVEDGSLRFHMAGLRKLLGDGKDGARYIATQVGVGYAFVAPVERHGEASPESNDLQPTAEELPTSHVTPNLPARLTHLIGRDPEIKLLEGLLSNNRLISIVGPAGVGKTTLAVEVGYRVTDRFEKRVTFVDLSMLENPSLVTSMIAGAMGTSVYGDDPLAVILGHLGDRSSLLILDNCEHVIEQAASLVERLIEAAPNVHVLATSREPLRAKAENVHRLAALKYPETSESLSRQTILDFPAVQLFMERAVGADTTLSLDDDEVRLIGDICRRLDGMALPIELTAVRVANYGVAATAEQIGERFSLTWPGRRTALPRQQTLQATLDWSYELLSSVERAVFERLSVFVGPFSIDAALSVIADDEIGTDQIASAVDDLAAKSLIVADRDRGGTFRMLEMTRAYAKRRWSESLTDLSQQVPRRHAAYFLSELEAIEEQGEEIFADQRPLRQQLGNIRSALDWSFGREGDRRIGVRLVAASTMVFLNLSHLLECRTWCARAIAEMPDTLCGTEIELELQAGLGFTLMFTRGNSDAAGDAITRALRVAEGLGDLWNQLRMLGRLHIFHERLGEYEIARAHADRAVEIANKIGEDAAIGLALSLSGISHHLAGDQARARIELEESLQKSPPSMRSRTIYYGFDHRNRSAIALARTQWLMGHSSLAAETASKAVEIAAGLNHPVTLCIALIWSLAVHTWMEDADAAETALSVFTECAKANALGPYIVAAEGFRSEISVLRGDATEAVEVLDLTLSKLRAARYELLTTTFSIALAKGLLLEDRVREAALTVDQAIGRNEKNNELFALPELMRLKAEIALRDADCEKARTLLAEAADLAEVQGAEAWSARIQTDLSANF